MAGHDQETEHDHDHSWFDSKFAKLAGDIDNMGKELERLARMYDIHDWDEAALKLKHGLNGLSELNWLSGLKGFSRFNGLSKLNEWIEWAEWVG